MIGEKYMSSIDKYKRIINKICSTNNKNVLFENIDKNKISYWSMDDSDKCILEYDFDNIGQMRKMLDQYLQNRYSYDVIPEIVYEANQFHSMDEQKYKEIDLVNYMM